MKKLVLCLAAAIAFCACDSGETVITGNISDPVNIVYLVNIKGDTIDASQVTGGAFSLTCPFNPYTGVSILRGEGYDPINLIPDSWKITVSVQDDNISTEGSPLSYELQNLQQWALITFMDSYGDSTALEAIADEAVERDTGARGLRSICETALIDVMYDLPEYRVPTRVTVTRDDIVNKTAPAIVALQEETVA